VGRTALNKLGVKKCAHFKRFNHFAGRLASAARFDLYLCRRHRRRAVEPFTICGCHCTRSCCSAT